MIDGDAHDLDSLIDEFQPPDDEAPEVDLGSEVVQKKPRRRRHASCKPDGHIYLCPCPSCLKARPERAKALVSKKR